MDEGVVTPLAGLAAVLRSTISNKMVVAEAIEAKALGIEKLQFFGDREFLKFKASH